VANGKNARARRAAKPPEVGRRLPLSVVRVVEAALGTRLRNAVDDRRRAGMTWSVIARELNEAGRGRYRLTGAELRRFAVEAGVDLAPGPVTQRPLPPERPDALSRLQRPRQVRDSAPAVPSVAHQPPKPGTVAHAVSNLRRAAVPGRAPRRVDRPRTAAYVRSLEPAQREQLLVDLLLAKLAPVGKPIESGAATSVSVRTVSGGLPSLGRH
jgi:hypothetical protein